MQEPIDRIRRLMRERGLRQVDIANATGASKGAVSKWFSGTFSPRSEYLVKIANILDTTPSYLLTGEGSSTTVQSEQVWDNNVSLPDDTKLRRAPIINWVQAGAFAEMADAHHDDWEYFVDNGFGDNVHWLHVQGDSMSPEFKEGELLLVDQDRQPKAGDYVIALEGEQNKATFKKYKPSCYDETHGIEYCQLVAINPFYPPIDSRARPFKVIGVVVMHKRNLV